MVSKAAAKLYSSMSKKKGGRRRRDVIKLLLGYGFIIRSGRNYDIISHSEFQELRMNLTRSSGELATGWVSDAVKLIDRLLEMQKKGDDSNELKN